MFAVGAANRLIPSCGDARTREMHKSVEANNIRRSLPVAMVTVYNAIEQRYHEWQDGWRI